MSQTVGPSDTVYTHSEIQADEIRLLQHLPNPASKDLSFTVQAYPREQAPLYVALSYAWGITEATETISMNGAPFHIRPNLEALLQHVVFHIATDFSNGVFIEGRQPEFHTDREIFLGNAVLEARENTADGSLTEKQQLDSKAERSIHIWVDAICVDQGNIPERNSQVRLMGSTFSQAECVLSWLGAENEDGIPNEEAESAFCPFPLDKNKNWTQHQLNLMTSYLNRPYWNRMWVVQEYWLATSAIILAPHLCMSERDFYQMHIRWEWTLRKATGAASNFGPAASYLPKMFKRNTKPITLDKLISRNRHRECIDQRDRVFSLLALLDGRQGSAIRKYLPDYSLSRDEVVSITLAHIFEYEKGFEIEGYEEHFKGSLLPYDPCRPGQHRVSPEAMIAATEFQRSFLRTQPMRPLSEFLALRRAQGAAQDATEANLEFKNNA
jgi:hypothetical protein